MSFITEAVTDRVKAVTDIIELQPGDATRYEFAITSHPFNKDYVIVSEVGCGGMAFTSYDYNLEEVKLFFKEYGAPTSKELYRNWAGPLLNKGLAGYVTEKARCNPWVAIAALCAIYITKL